jgi:hypothetical protein
VINITARPARPAEQSNGSCSAIRIKQVPTVERECLQGPEKQGSGPAVLARIRFGGAKWQI